MMSPPDEVSSPALRISATAPLEPRLRAMIGATVIDLLALLAVIEVASAALMISASSVIWLVAATLMSPPAVTSLSTIRAVARLGISSAGRSPNSASTVLNRKFWLATPIELKASVTPTAIESPPPSAMVVMSMSLSRMARLSASTVTPPLPASMSLASISATALASTTFVAISALTASVVPPSPKALPPSDFTSPMLCTSIVARSVALTVTEPPLRSTVASEMRATTSPRTSLRATRKPAAVASLFDVLRLIPGIDCESTSSGSTFSQSSSET
jgi:hypothetical protein